jgi:hypothetical protein
MMEDFEKFEENIETDSKFREEIYSKAVRAGKRTYFFDVKSTRRAEYYLTVTESKKRFEQDGSFHYEKHKIFLYQEDFEKFTEGLQEVMTFIEQNQQQEEDGVSVLEEFAEKEELEQTDSDQDFTKIDFEAL